MSRMTGRTCYRVTWLGRLVLQVEVDVTGSPWVSQMDIGLHTSWRDARCEDFTPLHLAGLFTSAPIPFPRQKPVHNPPASPKPISEHVSARHPLPPARSPAKETK